ncbi:M23 family metallopeptidase [soil metagenome]
MKWIMTFLVGALFGAVGVDTYVGTSTLNALPIAASCRPVKDAALPCISPEVIAFSASAASAASSLILVPASESCTMPAPPAANAPAIAMPNQLLIPVAGIAVSALQDSFNEVRGSDRRHEAIDILAPKGAPVLAVADGKIAKLFTSKPGGLTVYQFDTTEKFAYYYAHLDRYAADVKEGMLLKRGDLLGYVGSSGNADPQAPHLHFAIFILGPEKQWWKGSPINPYPLLGGR